MCLTVPRKVNRVDGDRAVLQDGRIVSLAMVADVHVGDYLLVQADMALQKVSAEETKAMKTLMMEDYE